MTWQGLAAELELTPEQVVDLERIDREYGELYKETNRKITDPEAKKARTVELRDRKQADIKAVLTKDQYKKWQAIKQEQRTSRSQSRQQVAPAHQE